jgi:hypothetical protein
MTFSTGCPEAMVVAFAGPLPTFVEQLAGPTLPPSGAALIPPPPLDLQAIVCEQKRKPSSATADSDGLLT